MLREPYFRIDTETFCSLSVGVVESAVNKDPQAASHTGLLTLLQAIMAPKCQRMRSVTRASSRFFGARVKFTGGRLWLAQCEDS